jgi:Rad3-related DNA helicase
VVNFLGHFVLVNQLLPMMVGAGTGRIVHVSSRAAYRQAPPEGIDFDNLRGEGAFDAEQAYGRSKLANALFSLELASRLEGTGVTSNAVHPGLVKTNIARTAPFILRKAFDLLGPVITAAGGRSLILMTSYGMLQAVHGELEGKLAAEGIVLRMQGEAPRDDLLQALRAGAGEALLATDSFWEGIDVRGEALSLLALTRLPFRVPSEPVLQARAEKLEREGGNAFTGLLLPMAILKFKQGMGRLIRHREDRGIAIVLDPRILNRRYGHLFLDSLGWGEPEIVSVSRVPAIVNAWFRERENDS